MPAYERALSLLIAECQAGLKMRALAWWKDPHPLTQTGRTCLLQGVPDLNLM